MARVDADSLGEELRGFLALMVPLAVKITSIEQEQGSAVRIAYIDAKGGHEIVTWVPVSWEGLD